MSTPSSGRPLPRTDGPAKVSGRATYAADRELPGTVHACVVGAAIGLGRIAEIHCGEAESLPGVIAVITHRNAERLPYREQRGEIDPASGERLHVLQDDRVRFFGQPIAVAVAETLEQAEEAAARVRADYEREEVEVELPAAAGRGVAPAGDAADDGRGDADAALACSEVCVDQSYRIPRESHHPIEAHAVLAAWSGDSLAIHSKSQFVTGERDEIAAIFGLLPERVRVLSPFVGGAFGSALRTWPHVTLAALAARQLARPVKLVLTRRQMAALTGHRPPSVQRVALGADRDGRLSAIVHEVQHATSRYEQYSESIRSATLHLHSCPNVRTRYRVVPLDVSTPTYMRAPGESSGIFALECAMDELAVRLQLDPVELRLRNEPERDEQRRRPYSTRSTRECYRRAGERFGWSRRDPRPRSMRDGNWLVGWGMATATYPAWCSLAHARARLHADGSAEIESSTSDMGPGTYTSLAQIAADALGLPVHRVRVRLGDSSLPPAPAHGASQTLSSVGSAVWAACGGVREELASLASKDPESPLHGADEAELVAEDGRLHARGERARGEGIGEILERRGLPSVEAMAASAPDPDRARHSIHSFGAVFAEVAVDVDLAETRVRRLVGAYGVGRVVNPLTARSQCLGGMVGGLGMALLEEAALDARDGRVVSATLAEYLVPVNKDVTSLEALFVDEEDPHVNALGAKGLGEIALVGVAPAIANAVFHATGKRIRELPITLEKLL